MIDENRPKDNNLGKPKRSGGRASRQKGDRREREIVAQHIEIGIHSERVPLSGAQRYQGNGADIDVYALGRDAAPMVCEVKARKVGASDSGGFTTMERWLSDYDALFLKRDRRPPLVLLPWRSWERLLKAIPGAAVSRQPREGRRQWDDMLPETAG